MSLQVLCRCAVILSSWLPTLGSAEADARVAGGLLLALAGVYWWPCIHIHALIQTEQVAAPCTTLLATASHTFRAGGSVASGASLVWF